MLGVLGVRTQAHLLGQTAATRLHFLKPPLEEGEEVEPGPKQTACREAVVAVAELARQGYLWELAEPERQGRATRAGQLFLHLARTAQAAAAAVLVVLAVTVQQARSPELAGLERHPPSMARLPLMHPVGLAGGLAEQMQMTRPQTLAMAAVERLQF